MKAKIICSMLLLMALAPGGSSKNFCHKSGRHGFAPAPGTACIREAAGGLEEEPGARTVGLSPISLFIFQLN